MTRNSEDHRRYFKREIQRLEVQIAFAEETISEGKDHGQFYARDLPFLLEKLETYQAAYDALAPSDKHAVTYPLVTRLELISNAQRQVVEYGVSKVWTSLQDEGRTLKIFKEVEDGS